jgi:carbamoyl-phosphate synthase large subunit
MMGFTDARLAKLTGFSEQMCAARAAILGVNAVFKRIDTCAAEFEAQTPICIQHTKAHDGRSECEARPSDRKKKS